MIKQLLIDRLAFWDINLIETANVTVIVVRNLTDLKRLNVFPIFSFLFFFLVYIGSKANITKKDGDQYLYKPRTHSGGR